MRFKKLTISLAVFIVCSAAFMNKFLSWFYGAFGRKTFEVILLITFLSFAIVFLSDVIRRRFRLSRKVMLLIFFVLSLYFLYRIKILAERAHLFEYGILGFLAMRDLRTINRIKAVLISFIFILAVGIIDELFQAWLPYRYGTVSDVILNAICGAGGIILFLIAK